MVLVLVVYWANNLAQHEAGLLSATVIPSQLQASALALLDWRLDRASASWRSASGWPPRATTA